MPKLLSSTAAAAQRGVNRYSSVVALPGPHWRRQTDAQVAVGVDSVGLNPPHTSHWLAMRIAPVRPHNRSRRRTWSNRSLPSVWRSPGYWVPAAQVADGLAVLTLDGVFEQVGQLPAAGDAGDVGHPTAGTDRDDEPFVVEGERLERPAR